MKRYRAQTSATADLSQTFTVLARILDTPLTGFERLICLGPPGRLPVVVAAAAVELLACLTSEGGREVLGVDVGNSEDETFWTAFLRSLKTRGLSGVRLVISDAHAGLKAAIRKTMSGTSWQRCRVHYMRNLHAVIPRAHQDMVSAAFRTIFAVV